MYLSFFLLPFSFTSTTLWYCSTKSSTFLHSTHTQSRNVSSTYLQIHLNIIIPSYESPITLRFSANTLHEFISSSTWSLLWASTVANLPPPLTEVRQFYCTCSLRRFLINIQHSEKLPDFNVEESQIHSCSCHSLNNAQSQCGVPIFRNQNRTQGSAFDIHQPN